MNFSILISIIKCLVITNCPVLAAVGISRGFPFKYCYGSVEVEASCKITTQFDHEYWRPRSYYSA